MIRRPEISRPSNLNTSLARSDRESLRAPAALANAATETLTPSMLGDVTPMFSFVVSVANPPGSTTTGYVLAELLEGAVVKSHDFVPIDETREIARVPAGHVLRITGNFSANNAVVAVHAVLPRLDQY